MRIGPLNKRIILQSMTKTADGMGGFSVTWKNEITIWAAIWPVSATEQVQAMQTVMTITHRIRIRYVDDIKASWRIKFGEKFFNIISIINPNISNKYLDILAKEAS